jgi:hypothetical protein
MTYVFTSLSYELFFICIVYEGILKKIKKLSLIKLENNIHLIKTCKKK